ncbi:MAG: hypothetical protein MJE77_11040 [Proteobacteria bacterium]|nr:hypothetical protein [Pseudomonadota bacterium]
MLQHGPFSSGQPIPAAWATDVEDHVNYQYHGDRVRHLAPNPSLQVSGMSYHTDGYLYAAHNSTGIMPVAFNEGDRIKALGVKRMGAGPWGWITVELRHISDSGVATLIAVTARDPQDEWILSKEALDPPHTVGTDGHYDLMLTLSAQNHRMRDIQITYDRPAP